MDALITKDGVETKLSSIGLLVTDFRDSSSPVTTDKGEVTDRSDYIFSGAVHKEKRIVISGTSVAPNVYVLEEKKDEINGLASNDEPFYITKSLPTANLYGFEPPGQKTGDLDSLIIPRHVYKYHCKIIVENEFSYMFVGFSAAGVRMKFSSEGKTAELPSGETIPKTVLVSTSIDYAEIAKCSQLEWPWIVKLTANQLQDRSFFLEIGDRTLTYQTQTTLENGDILLLKGMGVTLSGLDVNDKTNYEHFILASANANKIGIQTNPGGTIQLPNFAESYK